MVLAKAIKGEYIQYLKLFFFSVYIFVLPIAHTAAIQSFSLVLFLLLLAITDFKKVDFKNLLKIKWLLVILFAFIVLAYLSLFYSIDIKLSLKEVNKELVRNVLVMILVFLFFSTYSIDKITPYIYSIIAILFIHTIINLYTWYLADFSFNVRTGGLLDGYINKGGGERFAIWTSFAISASIAIFLYKNKFIGAIFFILSLLSMFSTQTRAGYLAAICMIVLIAFATIKSRLIKVLTILFFIIFIIGVYLNSHNFSYRYNLKASNDYIALMKKAPNEMGEEYKKLNLDYSISSRISMWKAAIIHILDHPFEPTGYGRFLYGKNIVKLNSKENQPFAVYSQVHNEFIGVLFSLGIFGLILFLSFWIYFLKKSYSLIKNNINNVASIFGFTMFFGGIGFIVNLCFGSFFGDTEAKFFYMMFGIILAISIKNCIKNF